jgi:uncharacterized membrane protein
MSLLKDLSELVKANVITSDIAQQISDYYKNKQETSPNRQMLILGILGALLVGIGIMFIIANQWDDLSQTTQTFISFLLLIIPQLLGAFVIIKKMDKNVWKECAALLLFFAVGSSISLISQIYHINGDMSSYLRTWMMSTVLLIYIFDSSAVSLAYLIGIMSYGLSVSIDSPGEPVESLFWLFLVLPLPHYFKLIRKSPDNPLLILHHWVYPFVLTLSLFATFHTFKTLIPTAYISLFGAFYLAGNLPYFRNKSILYNGYVVFGLAGTIVTLLVMSFQPSWKAIYSSHYTFWDLISTTEFIANSLLLLLASALLYLQKKGLGLKDLKLAEITFLLFIAIFVLGNYSSIAYIFVNLLVLILSAFMVIDGSKRMKMSILNAGLVIIALLAACRSFDSDIKFVVKGSMFVLVGIGFFVANWLMLKKKKENES